MRGYGDSDKPKQLEAYEITQLIRDVRELVTTLGEKPVRLLPHHTLHEINVNNTCLTLPQNLAQKASTWPKQM